jgi:hypothetical protein
MWCQRHPSWLGGPARAAARENLTKTTSTVMEREGCGRCTSGFARVSDPLSTGTIMSFSLTVIFVARMIAWVCRVGRRGGSNGGFM